MKSGAGMTYCCTLSEREALGIVTILSYTFLLSLLLLLLLHCWTCLCTKRIWHS